MNDNQIYDIIEELGYWHTQNNASEIRDFMHLKGYDESDMREAIVAFYEAE